MMRTLLHQRFVPVLVAMLGLILTYLYRFAHQHFRISPATITDVDTLMKLAYIRDILAHGWQGGFFARNNAPYGMVLHWTKPFYYVIIGLSRCFWFLPPERALTYAGFWTGPLFGLATVWAAYWAGRPFLRRWFAATAAAAIAISTLAVAYSNPGTANHHAPVLMIALLLFGFAVRAIPADVKLKRYILAGALAGFGLWLSFELIVAGQLLLIFLLYLWVWDDRSRLNGVLAFATFYGLIALLALLYDPPYAGLGVPELDRICLPYFILIACELAIVLAALRLPLRHRFFRVAYLAAGGGLTWFLMTTLYPAIQRGASGQVNPVVASEWQASIAEMVPILSPWMLLTYLGNAMVGLGLGLLYLPPRLRYHAVILLVLTLLTVAGQEHVRLSGYAWAGGTYLTVSALQAFADWYAPTVRGTRTVAEIRYVLGMPVAGLAVIFGCAILADYSFIRPITDHYAAAGKPGKKTDCALDTVLPALNDVAWLGIKPGDTPIFATNFDFSEGILYWTDYRTLAGNYHSDAQGINDEILLFRDLGDRTAHEIVDERGIRYLLLCPPTDRNRLGVLGLKLYQKYTTPKQEFSQPTLYTRLGVGKAPDWLSRRDWPEGVKTDFILYEVTPDDKH